eukprot:SAG31_NODE_90_length_26410_cov_175.663981_25_plen_108_part_00
MVGHQAHTFAGSLRLVPELPGRLHIHGDTFSISALHLAIKVPYFSNRGHKNEKVTSYLPSRLLRSPPAGLEPGQHRRWEKIADGDEAVLEEERSRLRRVGGGAVFDG